MKTAFTIDQIQDYLDNHIRHIERSAVAYQKFNLNVVEEKGQAVADLDFQSFEDIEDESISISICMHYTKPDLFTEMFLFNNITDEELSQKIVDAFVEAGLPDSDQAVYDIMHALEQDHNQPDTVVLVMNDGVIDSVATSKKIQVLVLDDDLEGLTDEEIEESAISIPGSSNTYYVPNLHVKVDPAFTVDIHNRANKL